MRSVSVFVPGTCGAEPRPELQKEVVSFTARKMSEVFGGATAYPARGYWIGGDGELVEEDVVRLSSFVPHDVTTSHAERVVQSLARKIRLGMQQESVLYEVDSQARFL